METFYLPQSTQSTQREGLQNYAVYAISKKWDMTIDEQRHRTPCEFEIRHDTLHKIPREARLVTGFQQSGPELTMDFDCGTDDGSGYLVNVHSGYSECSVVNSPLEVCRGRDGSRIATHDVSMPLRDL